MINQRIIKMLYIQKYQQWRNMMTVVYPDQLVHIRAAKRRHVEPENPDVKQRGVGLRNNGYHLLYT